MRTERLLMNMTASFRNGRREGFTLVELVVSLTILMIITALGFGATMSSVQSVSTSQAKEIVQGQVRDVLQEVSREVQLAAKVSNVSLTPPLAALEVKNGGSEISFQIPLNNAATVWSTPITYRLINEDLPDANGYGNAKLDPGEDKDWGKGADRLLTRSLVRIQDGVWRNIAGATDLSTNSRDTNNVIIPVFSLSNGVLTVTVSSTRSLSTRETLVVRASASTQIFIQN
jgi:type II secretory pathway pseudopilin PulG